MKRKGRFEEEIELEEDGEGFGEMLKKRLKMNGKRWLAKFLFSAHDVISQPKCITPGRESATITEN